MQSFNCNGIWWLPANPSKRVAGSLRFSADKGVDLSLAGAFGDYPTTLESREIDVILGLIWDCSLGKVVTLKGCLLKSSHFGSHTIAREDYSAELLFIGLHLEKEDDFLFSKISVQFSGLPSWANTLTGLSHTLVRSDKTRRRELEILWQAPEPLGGRIPGGDLTLDVGAMMSADRRQQSIKEEVTFAISCDQLASYRDLNARFVYPLENFLTLATDTPNALVEFNVTRHGSHDVVQVLGQRTFNDDEAATDLVPYSMLFSLDDVQEQAVGLISKWIEISHRLENVCNLYFGVQYKPESFLDTRFMLVCQSLELYQRKRQPVGMNHRGPSDLVFNEELARLLEEHRVAVGPLFGSEMRRAISELTEHRNYVIYRDSMVGLESDYGPKLFWLTQKLMFLMKACLLTELGIPSERQLKFFQNNQMYAHLVGMVGD
jgi:hypothetical protein